MVAPVVGFSAEVPNGIGGETFITVEPEGTVIEITINGRDETDDYRAMCVSHDEARQLISGLASVIT